MPLDTLPDGRLDHFNEVSWRHAIFVSASRFDGMARLLILNEHVERDCLSVIELAAIR